MTSESDLHRPTDTGGLLQKSSFASLAGMQVKNLIICSALCLMVSCDSGLETKPLLRKVESNHNVEIKIYGNEKTWEYSHKYKTGTFYKNRHNKILLPVGEEILFFVESGDLIRVCQTGDNFLRMEGVPGYAFEQIVSFDTETAHNLKCFVAGNDSVFDVLKLEVVSLEEFEKWHSSLPN